VKPNVGSDSYLVAKAVRRDIKMASFGRSSESASRMKIRSALLDVRECENNLKSKVGIYALCYVARRSAEAVKWTK